MKKCTKCSETKELTEFYSRGSFCKSCKSKWQKTWYSNNIERIKQQQKNYRENNKEYLAPKHHQCNKEWATKISGVYGIFNNECLYVGESKRVNARLSDHKYYIHHPESKIHKNNPIYHLLSQHTHLEFRILEETPNHREREKYWINQLKPKYNVKDV
jgi:hypothetical protein